MKKTVLVTILLVLSLAACEQNVPSAVSTPAPTRTAVSNPPTAAPTRTPRPSPTPEPTPIIPAIDVSDQTLADEGTLTITRVTVPEPAWLVIHALHEGQVGEVLGYTAVSAGTNEDLAIIIDPLQATPQLVAMLHVDEGEVGTYEFPGPDNPWLVEDEAVAAGFDVDIQAVLPSITVADQELLDNGLVRIESAYSPKPGWLLLHADDDGAVGPLLGHIFLRAGLNENLSIPIPWREATPLLHAVLYEDDDRPNRLDYPDGDLPVLLNGQPLITSFTVSLPPDVYVLDQPVVDGKITVERVVSDKPGWLVIYFDENDLPGRIIGSAPLNAGVNELIEINLLESAVTDILHIRIHEDDEPVGQFTFPNGDGPRLYQGRLPASFTVRTNGGNYFLTTDQPLEETAVIVPLVVTNTAAWAVIRDGEFQDTGDILGKTWLPAGINRDVRIELEADPTGESVTAVLHADLGEPETFDFPDGADQPLRHNGRIIQSSFKFLQDE